MTPVSGNLLVQDEEEGAEPGDKTQAGKVDWL
jgi:hypothetical protein